MYYNCKNTAVSNIKQVEDKENRFDYCKTKIDFTSGIRGDKEKIRDSRWFNGREDGKRYGTWI